MKSRRWDPFEAHIFRWEELGQGYLEWLRRNTSSKWAIRVVRERIAEQVPRDWLEKRIRELEKAGALVAAEIDRLLRLGGIDELHEQREES